MMQIYSRHLEVTEPLRVYLDEKIGRLYDLRSDIISLRVDLSRDDHHRKGDVYRVEANLNLPNKFIRVVEIKPDVREAIDLASDKLLRQVRDYKDRKLSWRRRVGGWLRKGKR